MLSPGQIVERYTVEAEIGVGGLATVYRVRHNALGNAHALKVVHVRSAAMFERLVLEGRVQAALRHPNIVSVTDVIDVSGAPGLVMEYVEGPTLDAWLRTHRPTLAEAEALFRAILAGVAYAHRQGLIHRDLKPGNVLLQPVDGEIVPKVADFGLVKILAGEPTDVSHTRSNVGMGTPAYMSPEQMQDAKRVDQRTDVFALGCILYELVCGRRAFEGPNLLGVFNAAATGRYVAPDELVPGLPRRVVDAITGALHPDRDTRIPDCSALRRVFTGSDAVTTGGGGVSAEGIVLAEEGARLAARGVSWAPAAAATQSALVDSAVSLVGAPAAVLPTSVPEATLGLVPFPGTMPPSPRVATPAPPNPTLPPTQPRRPPARDTRWALWGAAGGATLLLGGVGLAAVLALIWRLGGGEGRPVVPPHDPTVNDAPTLPTIPEVPNGVAAGGLPVEAAPTAPSADAGSAVRGTAPATVPPRASAAPTAVVTPAAPGASAPAESTPPDAPTTAPAPDASASSAPPNVPASLRGGTDNAREEALAAHEDDPAMTAALVWVLQNDPVPAVRFKAWRVVRARWRAGTGTPAEHERAVVWVVEHGTTKMRLEAVAALRANSRTVASAATGLADPDTSVRLASVAAVLDVARRAGEKPAARRLLEARVPVETSVDVKAAIADAVAAM